MPHNLELELTVDDEHSSSPSSPEESWDETAAETDIRVDASANKSLELNSCGVLALLNLTGCTPAVATRLVAARPFSDMADLVERVKGIGVRKAEALQLQGCYIDTAKSDADMPDSINSSFVASCSSPNAGEETPHPITPSEARSSKRKADEDMSDSFTPSAVRRTKREAVATKELASDEEHPSHAHEAKPRSPRNGNALTTVSRRRTSRRTQDASKLLINNSRAPPTQTQGSELYAAGTRSKQSSSPTPAANTPMEETEFNWRSLSIAQEVSVLGFPLF